MTSPTFEPPENMKLNTEEDEHEMKQTGAFVNASNNYNEK